MPDKPNKIDRLIQKLCPDGVEYKELGEIGKVHNGFAFQSNRYSLSGIRVIRISDVQKGKISNKDIKFYPFETEESIKNYLLNKNDLVMSLTGNAGRVAMLSENELPAALNQRVACIRSNTNLITAVRSKFKSFKIQLIRYYCSRRTVRIKQSNNAVFC